MVNANLESRPLSPKTPRVYDSLLRAARAFFLLEAPERAARSLSADRRRELRRLRDAAANRTSVVADLRGARHAAVGVSLYCDAVELLFWATLVMHGDVPSPDTADASSIDAAFTRLIDGGKIDPFPYELEGVRRLVAHEPRLSIESLGPAELAARRASLEAAVMWLRQRIEPRTVGQIRRRRIARLASAAVVMIALVGWALVRVASPRNVALHRPVTASSRHTFSTAPQDGSGLVDGIKGDKYDIHTLQEMSPWVMIDLGKSRKIARVKIYNRGDGWTNEGLPFALELSEDGQQFTEVARRTEPFDQLSPWTYSGTTHARYVRVSAPHLGYIALSEIEVFER